jgi:UDP-N-acetylglucosamine 3-dehydrogenase
MADIRLGVIGLGSMGRHHTRVARETPGVELAAVADPSGDRFGAARDMTVLPDVDALIAAGIDAAIVAVPTAEHEAVALALAEAGVHTMVEKPIADTAAAGERVAAAFEEAGLVGVVGYVERCNPAMVEMRRRLLDGQLGEIYQITTSRQSPFPARIADVGVVKDLATHDVDLTAWIAGSEYASIAANTAFRSGRQFEDMVVASGRLANGIIVNHLVNWLSPFKERRTVVTGERGSLVADTLTGDITFYENGTVETEWEAVAVFRGVSEGSIIRYAIPKREPLLVEAEGFRDAILGKPSESVPMRAAVRTVQVVEAMLESAESGDVVRL